MNRRDFLSFPAPLIVAAAKSGTARAAETLAPVIDVVERFGFVPDGKTDNYAAFHRLAAFATRSGGGRFRFPPGKYWVEKYRTTNAYQRPAFRAARPAEVVNAQFVGCNGLELIGDNATILLNGAFHRSRSTLPNGIVSGLYAAIFLPFELRLCSNVLISGFEIDGGVRSMTRDSGVNEAYAALISLNACRGVTLRNLVLHHSQTDAILLMDDRTLSGNRGIACRDVRIEDVRCFSCARGALAAIQIYGLTCLRSSFNGSAFGTGDYGHHAPGFGVDVEPDRFKPAEVDTRTGNLHFEKCEFLDNYSAFLAAYCRKYQGYLRLIDCVSSNRHDAPNHMIICWPGAIVQGGSHDLGSGTFWTAWMGVPGGDLTVRDATFHSSSHFGLFHAFPGNIVRLERVTLTGTHTAPTFGAFPAIQADPGSGRKNSVSNCSFHIPKARKAQTPAGEPLSSFNHAVCTGNSFETDLPADSGRYFLVIYGDDCVVRGDHYRGTAPGMHDTIRPSASPPHNTRQPFSRGPILK